MGSSLLLLGKTRKPGVSVPYTQTVLSVQNSNLLAFWPLNETSGTTADNAQGVGARDGTYSNVTLNDTPGPKGENAGTWNGTNSFVDIFSNSLSNALNGAEGSMAIWFKVSQAGVWSDGLSAFLFQIRISTTNRIFLTKGATTDQLSGRRQVGGETGAFSFITSGPTTWVHQVLTWSEANTRWNFYVDNVSRASGSNIGTWPGGTLDSAFCNIGINDNAGVLNPTDGHLQYAAIWNVELTASEVSTLYGGGPV